MFKTWTASHDDPEHLAHMVEAHLNEFAEEVVSVGYSVAERHHALVVYRQVEPSEQRRLEAAVNAAEDIVEEAQLETPLGESLAQAEGS